MSRRQCAFLIARLFPDHVPTAQEIMVAIPRLSRATAYRYAKDYAVAWHMAAKSAA